MSIEPASGAAVAYDVDAVRAEFPILARRVHGRPLVYLDSAATAQRPLCVVEAVREFYLTHNANVHRGVHQLSVEASERFEQARATVARALNARSDREIVFTRGATEAINLVAQAWARPRLKPGDEIIVSEMEHHSNIVPWQMLCEQTGAVLKPAPIDDRGELIYEALEAQIGERTRLIGLVHVSNALGTVNPVERVCALARKHGIVTVIDGCQAMPHLAVDVQRIGCDFYAFSAHKMYGPTGIGALYGRLERLEEMPPWQGGGEMILKVSFDRTVYNEVPHKFEAGTPNIAGAIGMAAAFGFLERIGLGNIARHEAALLERAHAALGEIPGLEIIGTARHKGPVVSFVTEGAHAHDIGTIVDHFGIAIRTGHHCAMPAMQRFGVPATARLSFGCYSRPDEIDRFVEALHHALGMLR
ncbi:MAG: cysteine desulfurase [Wenzhouxiangellaceae bacterium]